MTIQEIKDRIIDLAAKHKEEEDDEFAFCHENEAEDLILAYLVVNNIKLGDYDLKGLLEYDEEYELDRSDILGDLQLDLMNETPPFEVHEDAKELFDFYNEAFWPGDKII
jgi:hypothetical protein